MGAHSVLTPLERIKSATTDIRVALEEIGARATGARLVAAFAEVQNAVDMLSDPPITVTCSSCRQVAHTVCQRCQHAIAQHTGRGCSYNWHDYICPCPLPVFLVSPIQGLQR